MGAPKKEGLILPNIGDRGHGMENYRLPRQGSGLTFFQLYWGTIDNIIEYCHIRDQGSESVELE